MYKVRNGQFPTGRECSTFAEAIGFTKGWRTWAIIDANGDVIMQMSWPERDLIIPAMQGDTVVMED